MLNGKEIVLIISGGIAAYKSLDLIRRLKERGARVIPVMTSGAQEFITPLAVGALSAETVFTDLFDRQAEHDVGHIRLARDHDLVLIAPATANLLAKFALGIADDLATSILLATDKPVLAAPAMNPKMWQDPATARNVETLKDRGVVFCGPASGEMAERGEAGVGRMSEPLDIAAAAAAIFRNTAQQTRDRPLAGRHVLITAGPTHEPIDPVRYIANRSSGKQGYALAQAAAEAGARVTLVAGPVSLPDPENVDVVHVESAAEMLKAVESALPADIAIMAAAVADWRVASAGAQKIKKDRNGKPPALELEENPDILSTVGHDPKLRPSVLIGFAAETQDLVANALGKLERKNADWILANDVSPATGIMGGDANTIRLVSRDGIEDWPEMGKTEVARRIITRAAEALAARS
ncbi:bifunctional phosphopantothenoylcysteine decarboxylase/phosphopantothenate--cysteine ligase CoaBC [Rhodobacterales bacterium]|nr:bifunctional phosphopantothenoylcysteine decarboxylase/phosphopantothenate--cysteine ligase CoaBC [Rhodobacterales bacterium]